MTEVSHVYGFTYNAMILQSGRRDKQRNPVEGGTGREAGTPFHFIHELVIGFRMSWNRLSAYSIVNMVYRDLFSFARNMLALCAKVQREGASAHADLTRFLLVEMADDAPAVVSLSWSPIYRLWAICVSWRWGL